MLEDAFEKKRVRVYLGTTRHTLASLMLLSFQMSERRRTPVPSRALLILSGALGGFFHMFFATVEVITKVQMSTVEVPCIWP